ncbi:hypothetical protein JCM3770_004212 [Rhodotorula araucariae]
MPPRDAAADTHAVPRLEPHQCTYAYFRAHHLVPNTPCIFPPALVQDWPLRSRWLTGDCTPHWEYLVERYGALAIDCVDLSPGPDSGNSAPPGPARTFGALVALWRQGAGRAAYLKDWHLALEVWRAGERDGSAGKGKGKGKERVRDELYEVPTVCLDDWMNEWEGSEEGRGDDFRFVYAGGGDTFTPLHRDVYCSYSISTQIYGSKRWYLFPPSCTPFLRPLIAEAEHADTTVNCDAWSEARKEEFRARGMMIIEQHAGETIFIPSGYYHSVHNLSHPTVSLNHNWLNSHILPTVYRSLSDEAARCREAIDDVREMLVKHARWKGDGEEGWRREWELAVDQLVERSEGWSWPTFWRMTHHTLRNLDVPPSVLEERAASSRWPAVPPHARPPTAFVVDQVRPLLADFRARPEQEWRWLTGLDDVLRNVERELERLQAPCGFGRRRRPRLLF